MQSAFGGQRLAGSFEINRLKSLDQIREFLAGTAAVALLAPHVARAQGPRVLPVRYTVRLTDRGQVTETKLDVQLDRRAPFGVADRKAQLAAAIQVREVFDDMSKVAARINAARGAIQARLQGLPQGDALATRLQAVDAKLEDAKKKIVATKEGGAITGEERIREHLDTLYGAFMSWEGKPARYQLERADALRRELADVSKDVEAIMTSQVKPLDGDLRGRKLDPIPTEGGEQAMEDDEQDDGAGLEG